MSCLLEKFRFALPYFLIHTKKILLIFVFALACEICGAKPKIISSEPCEYRDVSCDFFGYQKWFKDEISCSQAEEDLDYLGYLLKTGYAGYDDASKRGLEIDQISELFKNFNKDEERIKVSALSRFICDFLNPYIQDCHFSIESKDFSKRLVSQYKVLYSNIYVKKTDDIFVVEKSDNQDFQVGKNLEIEKENLFLYPSEGENVYRIGVYAPVYKNENSVAVTCFSSKEKKLLLCNVSNNYASSNDMSAYKEIETADSVYIYIPTFMNLPNNDNRKSLLDENFEKLYSVSERYKDKKNVILDLRTNGGGNLVNATKFLANLYFLEKDCSEKNTWKNIKKQAKLIGDDGKRMDLISPSVVQAENWLEKNLFSQDKFFIKEFKKIRKILNNRNLRITYYNHKKTKAKSGNSNFKGKLIILSGKNSASASEGAILDARNIFSGTNQFFQIGENTAGCYAFGNVWCYQLPHSGIALHLSSFMTGDSEKCPEGLGIMPDYWATNGDIVQALVNVTGDENLTEKLKDINNNL